MKNRSLQIILILSLSLIFFNYTFAHGEESNENFDNKSNTSESTYYFDKIIVTGTGKKTELLQAPVSISIIDKTELKRSTQSQISDIIQDLPNIEVFDQSIAGMKRVRIRGESASRSVILIDGQRISEQKSMEGAPLLIDSNSVERIEVVKGPNSVLYGSDAIGGVINIITKKGGEKPLEGSISNSFNSSTNGMSSYGAIFGQFDNFEYRLSASRDKQENRSTPKGVLENSSSETKSYTALFGYKDKLVKAGFKFDYFNADINSHTPDSMYEEGSDFDYFQLDLPEWSRKKYALYYEKTNPDSRIMKVKVNAYYQNTFKDFTNDMDLNVGLKLRIRTQNDLDTYGVRFETEIEPMDNHIIVAGLSVSHDQLFTTGSVRTTWGDYAFPTKDGIKKSKFEAHLSNFAFFVQDEWNLNDFLTVILGLRQTVIDGGLDYSKVTGTNLLSGFSSPINVEKETSQDSHPTGGLTLLFRQQENLTFRLGYIQGYRFPNLQQLYIGTSHGSDTVVYPEPNLDPETSYTLEMGIRYYFNRGNFDLTVFNTEAENYISQKTHPEISGANIFSNIDKSLSKGAELSTEMVFNDLTPYLTVGHIQREFITSTYRTRDVGIPELKLRTGLKIKNPFFTDNPSWLDFFVRGESPTKYYDNEEDETEEFTSWYTINLGWGGEMDIWDKQFLFTLEALNLADKEYIRAKSSLYEPGRHIVAKLSANF